MAVTERATSWIDVFWRCGGMKMANSVSVRPITFWRSRLHRRRVCGKRIVCYICPMSRPRGATVLLVRSRNPVS